jgi:hypothetical protein
MAKPRRTAEDPEKIPKDQWVPVTAEMLKEMYENRRGAKPKTTTRELAPYVFLVSRRTRRG